jgi:hypothetical protein
MLRNTKQMGTSKPAWSIAAFGITVLTALVLLSASSESPRAYSASGPNLKDINLTEPSCTVQFSDVPFGTTFYPYVRCLACSSILGGYADGTFRPGNNITRGQLSKIVSNAAGFDAQPGAQSFADVATNSTFYDWIQRLAAKGYINGYPCGGPGEPCDAQNRPYFRPGANATRGQISKIVSNAKGFNDTPTGQTFEDVPSTYTFYVWIERLASRGVMGGYPCGGSGEPCGAGNRAYFRPQNNATRGQVAKIVSNSFFPNCYGAQTMIGDGVQLGLIDHSISVLYRAFALFGDRRLPSEYIGTGSSGEDQGLFYEATVLSNTIRPDILAQLQPFIVRPDDPASIFHDQTPVPTVTVQPQRSGDKASQPSVPYTDVYCDSHGWAALESAPGHFKAWARCTGALADPDTVQVLTDTLLLADTVWGPMTSLMGTPVPDQGGPNGGGDNAIDIYIVNTLDSYTINGRHLEITQGTLAYALSAPPNPGLTSSGFMVVPRDKFNVIGYRGTFVHEFFHILQYAHNQAIMHNGTGDEYWFTEASASWAEAHFDRTITNWPPRWAGREADYDTFKWFYSFQDHQWQWLPLHLSVPNSHQAHVHEYMAFIWPFFMEQQTGGPDAIANAWRAMEGTTSWDAALDAIGAQLPFLANFRLFAIRNIDSTFDGQNPIGVHYRALDSLFPEDVPPAKSAHYFPVEQPSDPFREVSVSVEPLNAQYYYFEPWLDDAGRVRRWDIDLSAVGPADNFDVDALLKHRDGTWELRTGISKNGVVKLCDVTIAWIIISNHERGGDVTGTLKVKALELPCTCDQIQPYLNQPWTASFTVGPYYKVGEQTNEGDYTRVTVRQSWNSTGTLNNWNQTWVTGTLTSGAGSVNDEIYYREPNGYEETHTAVGSGAPILYDPNGQGPLSVGELGFDLDRCVYHIRGVIAVNVSRDGADPWPEPVGPIAIDDIPIGEGTSLSGNTSLPVKCSDNPENIPFYVPGGFGGLLCFIVGEENMGTTQFGWGFAPANSATLPVKQPHK